MLIVEKKKNGGQLVPEEDEEVGGVWIDGNVEELEEEGWTDEISARRRDRFKGHRQDQRDEFSGIRED